jgi:hypothetical protein
LQNIVQRYKRQHYCRLIEKADDKRKTAWNIIRQESGKLQRMQQVPSVLINNEKVNDPHKIADVFNIFFLKITEKSRLMLRKQETMPLHFKIIPNTKLR